MNKLSPCAYLIDKRVVPHYSQTSAFLYYFRTLKTIQLQVNCFKKIDVRYATEKVISEVTYLTLDFPKIAIVIPTNK